MKPDLIQLDDLRKRSADAPRHRVRSPLLRLDETGWILYVRKAHGSSNVPEELELKIGAGLLPPTAIHPAPTRLDQRPELCWTIVGAVDAYLSGVSGSKSSHIIASDIVRIYFKLFEYLWLRGYYQVADVPPEAWESLRTALVEGGWTTALRIAERTAELLKSNSVRASRLLRPSHQKGHQPSVRGEALLALGTNIAGRELAVVRRMLINATEHPEVAHVQIQALHELPAKVGMSATMLGQCLRAMNLLAEIEEPLGISHVPHPDPSKFAEKNGRQGGRTENLTPERAAALLKESFRWVIDCGEACVRLVEALAVQLSPYFEPRMRDGRSAGAFRALKSLYAKRILQHLPERARLEELLGSRIVAYRRGRYARPGVTSVAGVLNAMYTACFVVLASMNARRKDELLHPGIGLEAGCTREVDEELGLYECRFYIEKTLRDYDWFFINDVSRAAIRILQDISELAWDWEDHVGLSVNVSKKRGLFCYPRFASHAKGPMLRFDFNSNNNGASYEFVSLAFAQLPGEYLVIAPHMFRRLYGLIYHYRYENSTLIALAQKYGHFDINSVFRYVQNGAEATARAHAAAIWSKPSRTLGGREQELESVWADVQAVGREKLIRFVEDVVAGVQRFGGGFEKLVSRFHRRMRGSIEYSVLNAAEQVKVVGDAFLSRGHAPQPFPHATCMAGTHRKHASCSSNGQLAKERARPEICSGCPYSVVLNAHLDSMKRDLTSLESACSTDATTVAGLVARRRHANLERVIVLNERRLANAN